MSQTPDHIIKKAEKEYPMTDRTPKETGYHENDVAEKQQDAYIKGLTEAINTEPLRKALEKIIDLFEEESGSRNVLLSAAMLAREALSLATGYEGKEVDRDKRCKYEKAVCEYFGIPMDEILTDRYPFNTDFLNLVNLLAMFDQKPTPLPNEGTTDADEKEVMMQAFNNVRVMFERRAWIMDGRGSYRYDDDRYKEEVRYLYDEFDALQKETWGKIKTKTFEYREKIIAEYKAANEDGAEAVAVLDWLLKHKEVSATMEDGDTLIIADGDFYWAGDDDGDLSMDGKDIYKLFKQKQ